MRELLRASRRLHREQLSPTARSTATRPARLPPRAHRPALTRSPPSPVPTRQSPRRPIRHRWSASETPCPHRTRRPPAPPPGHPPLAVPRARHRHRPDRLAWTYDLRSLFPLLAQSLTKVTKP